MRKLFSRDNIVTALDIEDDFLPSEKRAAVNLIELRTKLEVRTLFLKLSISLNMALITGIVTSLFLTK